MSSAYESLRKELLQEVEAHQNKEVIDLKNFDKKFNNLFEMMSFSLLNDSDMFYGTFLNNCNRVKCYGMGAPFAHQMFNSKVNLLINPLKVIELTMEETKVYVKHEIIHLLAMHYERVEVLKQRYPEMVPLMATDIITNVLLENEIGKDKMHRQMLTLDRFNEMFNETLEADSNTTTEELTETIYQLANHNEKLMQFITDYNSFVTDKIQEELEKQIEQYRNGENQMPENLEEELGESGEDIPGEMSEEQQMQQLAQMLAASIMKVKGEISPLVA